jgi:hypothetical protein
LKENDEENQALPGSGVQEGFSLKFETPGTPHLSDIFSKLQIFDSK